MRGYALDTDKDMPETDSTVEDADADEPPSSAPERPEGTDRDVDTSHLDDLDDGCGCAEVWEHLSERRGESG